MSTEPLPTGFGAALLFEFDIAERQMLALAKQIPAAKFAWRPDETARSVSEVLVHVAAGNFSLLALAGMNDVFANRERWEVDKPDPGIYTASRIGIHAVTFRRRLA